ncbi:MAG: DUF5024 domain-containing protein [Muribaculum sp.]|nr:DUF5024 domain-containing protein [Muribaculaceae bacterium]MCM1080598.1 DUF5024 domain-containing protein [Muribaculum sp.]
MRYRFITLLITLAIFSMPLRAQNSIDNLIDTYDTMGKTTFTSVVDRNKKTNKIQRIVKVLEVENDYVIKFYKAFEAEKNNCSSYKQTIDSINVTTIMTTDENKATRIYMLQHPNGHNNRESYITHKIPFKVSAITKFKNN